MGAIRLVATTMAAGALACAATATAAIPLGTGHRPTVVVPDQGPPVAVWGDQVLNGTDVLHYCEGIGVEGAPCATKRLIAGEGISGIPVLDADGRVAVVSTRPADSGAATCYPSEGDSPPDFDDTPHKKPDGTRDDPVPGTFVTRFDAAGAEQTTGIGTRSGPLVAAAFAPGGQSVAALTRCYDHAFQQSPLQAIGGVPQARWTHIDVDGTRGLDPLYTATTFGYLPDGRALLLGAHGESTPTGFRYTTGVRLLPKEANANTGGSWSKWRSIRPRFVEAAAFGRLGAYVLEADAQRGDIERGFAVSQFNGTSLGAPRKVSARTGGPGCCLRDADLFQDPRGRLHAVWVSRNDGCPMTEDSACLVYRRAEPGKPFGPKTVLARGVGFTEPEIAANRAGEGYVVWSSGNVGEGRPNLFAERLRVSSEASVKGKRIRLVTPTECIPTTLKGGEFTASIDAGGARIEKVTFISRSGVITPRTKQLTRPPFRTELELNKKKSYKLSPAPRRNPYTAYTEIDAVVKVGGTSVVLNQPISFGCTS